MRTSQLVFIIGILLCPILIFAQYSTIIDRDIPGHAISPHTIEAKILQVQIGVRYNTNEIIRSNRSTTITRMFSRSTVLRYGLQKRVELNAVLDWQSENLVSLRIKDIKWNQLGLRLNVLEQTNKKPGIGVDCQFLFPSFFNRRYNLGNSISFVVSKSISGSLEAIFNLGFIWGDNDLVYSKLKPAFYTLNISYSMNTQIYVFVEASAKQSINFNTYIQYNIGTSCLLSPNLQMDLSTGWSQKERYNSSSYVADNFIDARLSWRFDWDKSRRQMTKYKKQLYYY